MPALDVPILPPPMSFEQYDLFRADRGNWLDVVTDIARSHGHRAGVVPFANGTNLIVSVGASLVLKVFPPMLRHQFVSERLSLVRLRSKLSVATPEIVAEGERDGWLYLFITRLAGRSGDEVWSTLTELEKEDVLRQVGELITQVQAVPAGELLSLEPSWATFVPRQIAGCRVRHERLGLPQRHLDGLDHYLRDAASAIPADTSPVILTGEFIAENFMLEGSRIAGLIDFGDAMTGWGEYDLLGPSTFLCEGRSGRVRSLLGGFGVTDVNAKFTRRLMTMLLLHRFSDLAVQVRITNWQRVETLSALERLIWPLLHEAT